MFVDLESPLLPTSVSAKDGLCLIFSEVDFASLKCDIFGVSTLLCLDDTACGVTDSSLDRSALPKF